MGSPEGNRCIARPVVTQLESLRPRRKLLKTFPWPGSRLLLVQTCPVSRLGLPALIRSAPSAPACISIESDQYGSAL